jgi:hypothetical protein
LQNFSNLRATRALSPGTIHPVNGKELSEAVAEAAARTERAAALQQEARARQEVAIAKLEELGARWEEEWPVIVSELRDQRDERRALMEALFMVMDRLPPTAS